MSESRTTGEPNVRFDVAAGGNQASRAHTAARPRRLPPTLHRRLGRGSVRATTKNDLLSRAFVGCSGAAGARRQEVTLVVHDDGPVGLDGVGVRFDDERVVANAGIVLVATLVARLGIEALVERCVGLGARAGAANPGRKLLALVYAMALGADSIDDCDVLRSGATDRLLGGAVAAPSTLGTFLRAFTFGHVRQLDRVLAETLRRAWAAGAGPGARRLVIDVDSFVGAVHGYHKQGAAFGYTRQRGYHPLLATRSDSGEVLHVRLRKGSANTARGIARFLDELIARVDRAGATGEKLLRADSGFWYTKIFERLERAGWHYSIGVRMQTHVRAAVEAIPEHAWQTLPGYPDDQHRADRRNHARRAAAHRPPHAHARRPGRAIAELGALPVFATNRTDAIALVEAEHRQHAVVEHAIPDLKDQALAHFPSGQFDANAAWTVIACLTHNLLRWTQLLGLPGTDDARRAHASPTVAHTARPPDPQRTALHAAATRPLALAAIVHRSARARPSAAGGRLSGHSPTDTATDRARRTRRHSPLRTTAPQNRPQTAPTALR